MRHIEILNHERYIEQGIRRGVTSEVQSLHQVFELDVLIFKSFKTVKFDMIEEFQVTHFAFGFAADSGGIDKHTD